MFEVLGFNSIPLILSGTSNGVTLGNSSYVAFYLSINFFIALALLSSSLVRDKSEIISTRASKRRAMKKAAIKKRGKMAKIIRKRKKSMKKRKTFGLRRK